MDRITNESNLWLNAIKMEDEGNYLEAFLFYLKDSAEYIKQNSLVRAALSCSCAANCLAMTGNLTTARQLYMQTATMYENNAKLVIGESVREALWSYQEAYEYFNLACENNKAQHIYEKYVSLSKKVNPFVGEKEAMESLRIRNMDQESSSNTHPTNMQVSADIDNAIKNFLSEIGPIYDKPNQHVFQRVFKKILKEGNISEKSITN
jgi:tetratricopeptide (TPR) repeat protein